MQDILSIDELRVSSKKSVLLDIEQLKIKQGMHIAIVGGNGAGKTTLIESLLGLRDLSSGYVNWSCDPINMGVQLQQASYNTDMLVKEVILLQLQLYRNVDTRLYAAFNLSSLANKKYGVLSRGEKQRVDLYVALSHNPMTLVLDEPGTGLDKKYYKAFINKMNELKQRENFTLLMASHSALEVNLSSHLLWIEKGKVKKFNKKQVLFHALLGSLKVEMASENSADLQKISSQLQSNPCVNRISQSDDNQLMIFGLPDLQPDVLSMAEQYPLKKFSISEISEEDFLSFVGKLSASDE